MATHVAQLGDDPANVYSEQRPRHYHSMSENIKPGLSGGSNRRAIPNARAIAEIGSFSRRPPLLPIPSDQALY
jgi:hypothetical protein